MELFGEVLAGWRDDVESDVLIRRPSGDTRLLSVTATAIHQEGRIVGLHGIARDITEQRGAERALRESEAKFRQIAENVREVFWIFSPDFSRTVYISPAFERIWMRPLEEVYGDARASSTYTPMGMVATSRP
jgi:PAS domain-containing protein